MRVIILGSSPASTNPGGAASSYLIEEGATRLVLDCGNGSFGNLLRHTEPEDVTAIVISHMHADHVLDLLPYRYALFFGAHEVGGDPIVTRRPALYLPPEGHAKALAVSSLQDKDDGFFNGTFSLSEYDPTKQLVIGELTLSFFPVKHIPHTYAIRIAGDGCVLAYSADTGPCPTIYDAARRADLFLCECANDAGSDYPYHLTPTQAGEIAQAAGAQRLLLTHRWYRSSPEEACADARVAFGGPVNLAREGDVWDVCAP